MSEENGNAAPSGYVGELSEAARLAIQSIQQNQSKVQFQIGGLEVQKAQLLETLGGLQGQIKRVLEAEAIRLGIPPERSWQALPDGKVQITG